MVITLFLAYSALSGGDQKQKPSTSFQADTLQGTARQLVFETIAGNFISSLDMQEAADFLLTPALLQQEVVSAGVFVTYPNE